MRSLFNNVSAISTVLHYSYQHVPFTQIYTSKHSYCINILQHTAFSIWETKTNTGTVPSCFRKSLLFFFNETLYFCDPFLKICIFSRNQWAHVWEPQTGQRSHQVSRDELMRHWFCFFMRWFMRYVAINKNDRISHPLNKPVTTNGVHVLIIPGRKTRQRPT